MLFVHKLIGSEGGHAR